jgi:hypothetical protein
MTYDIVCWSCAMTRIIVFLQNANSIMKNTTFMNLFRINRQKTLRIVNLSHTIALWLDIHIMKQSNFSFSYAFMIRIVCIRFSFAWFAWLFYLNIKHIVLIIVKLQVLLMMSRNRNSNMQFNSFHFRHRLHIYWLVSSVFFSKHSFLKRLIWIEMSLIREMNILSEILNRMIFMRFVVDHS